jgi:antitoxin component YwqK of YwqJK toxin-antitoxin module
MKAQAQLLLATAGWLAMATLPELTAQTRKPAQPDASGPVPERRPASAVPNQGKAPVTDVIVEKRADGLAYLPGAKQPFTGNAITASKNFEDCVESITPYRNGRLHGEVMTLFKAGNPKTVRTYEDGVPKKAVAYYQDGAKKYEQTLNAKDKAEGLYRRWFASGVLQAEASYDDEERWHGVNKEFSEDGKLKAHYVFDHGTLQKIVFESHAAKAAREALPKALPTPKR